MPEILVTEADGKQTKVQLPDQPLNVVVHQQGTSVDVPTFVEVNPEDTINCIRKMTEGEWKWISTGDLFRMAWATAFPKDNGGGTNLELPIPPTVAQLNKLDFGMRHVAGMITLCCEAMFANRNVFLRNPETYLHPNTERTIVGMLQKIQATLGQKGTITKTKEKNPPGKIVPLKREQPKAEMPNGGEEFKKLKETVKFWLECMDPNKVFARSKEKEWTVKELIEEVVKDTPVGAQVIQQFFNKQHEVKNNEKDTAR